ncbi:MAG TPA: Stk1 family PASTA domain-containing Ser/Thr kinase, partial [Vitreimonas sp.]|nr:Stk1 family PASTA domain-containing Ser/Thr kinase [Vitreimonas sp.]
MADIGNVLGGRYRLIELLGQGGMATIYRARDNQLERDVAVKLLRPEYGRDPDFLSRFRQEAQAAASLNHPNVVSVFDYGQDNAGPFIVMELIDGEDLSAIIRRTGALPPRQAARLTADAARALEVAHRRGIVHRDVKPGNIMVGRDGRVKVTDFGIARAVAEAQMTLPGTTLGSVHYFSPEQARGEATTPGSDVYSLGIVLYELLTGRRPWGGDSAAAIAMARLSGAVPSPSAARAGIPPALEAIVRRAMSLDPAARYATGGALAEVLDGFLADQGASSSGLGAAGAGLVPAGHADEPGATSAATLAGAAGVGAAGAAGAGAAATARPTGPATVASGVARPNASRVPYAPDAYAGADDDWQRDERARRARAQDDRYDEDERDGTSPWVWISALLALAILAVVGFLVVRLFLGTGAPPAQLVTVPSFVGDQFQAAQAEAEGLGIRLVAERSEERSDVPENQILSQDVEPGDTIERGGQVNVVIAVPPGSVTVPSLINRPEGEAVDALIDAQLRPGTRSEDYHPAVPQGNVWHQSHAAGTQAAPGTRIDFVVSRGPEPTPSP